MPLTTSGNIATECLATLARAVALGDALQARACAQELADYSLIEISPPVEMSGVELAIAAAVLELLGERSGQSLPAWTATVGAVPEPVFLVDAANRFPNLRRQCELESPEPLRRRNLFAPANYLTWA